jgi:hypothetical protein
MVFTGAAAPMAKMAADAIARAIAAVIFNFITDPL